MKKPELAEYGLKGIDERPQIDVEAMPVSKDELAAAIERIINWQVESIRVSKFRSALFEWNLVEHGYDESGRKVK